MAARGRPSRFNEALAENILALAQTGQTDEQICSNLGIPLRTLYNWKGRHPDFKQALSDSKSVADDLVEATLFQLAIGYRHPSVKIVYDRDTKKWVSHAYMEILAPDPQSCMFWLRNRKPDQWRSNPPEVPEPPPEGEVIDTEWKVQILGEDGKTRSITSQELNEADRYYDRKPPPLKVVGPPVES